MAQLTLYHNPNCSKSRGAKEILEAAGVGFELVEYLSAPLSAGELRGLLEKLGIAPIELVRKDSRFREIGLDESDYQSKEAVAVLLAAHPELMQRPVVVKGKKALIARPSELVQELL